MAKLIKYMGTADVREILKGENFGGRLANSLTKRLEWSKANNWIVDVDETGLSPEAVELLLEDPGFKDVSELKKIPANEHQRIFLGMGASDPVDLGDEVPVTGVSETSEGGDRGSAVGGSTPTTGGRRTTTGGSTRGAP